MTTPSPRTPVRPGRGLKAALDTALAATDIKEGELVYAKDEDKLYMVEGGVFVAAGGGGGGAVDSVNGQTGVVVLDVEDLDNVKPPGVPATVMLNMEGANNGTIFTDTSPNGYAITRNGAAVTSSTQFKYGSTSLSLPSAGSNLLFSQADSEAAFAFGSDDFTVEAWVYCTVASTGNTVYGYGASSSIWASSFLEVNSTTGALLFTYSLDGNNPVYVNSTTVGSMVNSWHHVAICRSGGNLYGYIDGVQVINTTITGTLYHNPSAWCYVGATNGSTSPLIGYMDDFRVVKGTALYTTVFTPPTAALDGQGGGATDGQVLTWVTANNQWEPVSLPASPGAPVDSVNGQTGTVVLDLEDLNNVSLSEAAPSTIVSGRWATKVSGTFPTAAGQWYYSNNSSILIHGTDSDAVSNAAGFTTLVGNPTSYQIQISNDNFATILHTANCTAASSQASGRYSVSWDTPYSTDSMVTLYFRVGQSLNTPTYAPATDGQVLTWVAANNQWEPADTLADSVQSVAGKTGAVTLELTDNTDVGLALNAPSLPAGTVVAITGEGTNGETTFVNSATANSGDGTAAGNAQISNAQSKFYGTSIALDGSGDAVVIAHDDEQNLGGNDFTVQFWVRFNSLTNGLSYGFCDKSSANTTDVGWRFWYSHSTTGNSDFWYQRSSNGFSLSSEQFVYTSNRLAVDTWYHIRLCQFGGTALCFLDGVHIGSSNPTAVFEWASSADLKIGAQYTTNSNGVNGYFNDFQIINGTALSTSTASFTPPSTGIGTPTPAPPTDGQVLTYVAANSQWEPATLGASPLRAALGIGEYVDDAAAGTGGVASGAMYYNTTSSDYRLKT